MAPVSLASFPLARRLHLRPLIGHPHPIRPTVHSTAHQVFPRIQPGNPDPTPANTPSPRTIFVPFPSPPQTLSVREPHPSTAMPPPHPPARLEQRFASSWDAPVRPSVIARIRKSPVDVSPAGGPGVATSGPRLRGEYGFVTGIVRDVLKDGTPGPRARRLETETGVWGVRHAEMVAGCLRWPRPTSEKVGSCVRGGRLGTDGLGLGRAWGAYSLGELCFTSEGWVFVSLL